MVGTAEWEDVARQRKDDDRQGLRTVFEIPGGAAAITDDGRGVRMQCGECLIRTHDLRRGDTGGSAGGHRRWAAAGRRGL